MNISDLIEGDNSYLLLWCAFKESSEVVLESLSRALIIVNQLHQSGFKCACGFPASLMSWLLIATECETFLEMKIQGILAEPKQVEPLVIKGRTLHIYLNANLPEYTSQQYFDMSVHPFMLYFRKIFMGVWFNVQTPKSIFIKS